MGYGVMGGRCPEVRLSPGWKFAFLPILSNGDPDDVGECHPMVSGLAPSKHLSTLRGTMCTDVLTFLADVLAGMSAISTIKRNRYRCS